MSYENLIDWTGSDATTELMMRVFVGIRKELRHGLSEPISVDECNTAGAVNVCLAIEAGVFSPFPLNWFEKSDLAFFERVKKGLQKEIKSAEAQKEWASPKEKREHLVAFKRMNKNLDHFVKMIRKASR